MWLFEKGALGVVFVVLSLFASVLFGVVINVTQEDVQKNVPEYVTDITGLYEGDSDQTYVDYSPSANFNGYTQGDTSFTYPNSGTRTIETVSPHVSGATYIQYGDTFYLPAFLSDKDVYYINTNENVTLYHTTGTVIGTEFGPFIRSSATTWVWGAITVDTSNFKLVGTGDTVYTLQYKVTTSLMPTSVGSPRVYDIPSDSTIKLTDSGVVTYIPVTTPTTLRVEYGNAYVVIGSTTYNCTDVGVATNSSTITYTREMSDWDTMYPQWFSYRILGAPSSTFTSQDIIDAVTNAEVTYGESYGRINLTGNVTSTNGGDTYVGPIVFFKSDTGWEGLIDTVGDIGDISDFTYSTSDPDSRIAVGTYATRSISGATYMDFTISEPMGFKITYGGTSYVDPARTTKYLFAEPVGGHIIVDTSSNTLEVNGTTILQSLAYPTVEFILSDVNANLNPEWPHRIDFIYYYPGSESISDYTIATGRGTTLNEHNISYGNGIPDDQQYGFYYIESSVTTTLHDVTGTRNNTTFGPYHAISDTTWRWQSRTASTTQFSFVGPANAVYTVTSIGFTQIVIPYSYDLTVPDGYTVVKMTINGVNTYLYKITPIHIIKTGNLYTVDGTNYTDVDAIYVATYDNVTLTYTADINDYPVNFKPSMTGNNYKFSYSEESTVTVEGHFEDYESTDLTSITRIYPNSAHVPIASMNPRLDHAYGDTSGWKTYLREINLKTIIDTELVRSRSIAPSSDTIVIDFPMTVREYTQSYNLRTYDGVQTLDRFTWTYRMVDNPVSIGQSAGYVANDPFSANYLSRFSIGYTIHLVCEYNIANETCSIIYDKGGSEEYTLWANEQDIGALKVYIPYKSYFRDTPSAYEETSISYLFLDPEPYGSAETDYMPDYIVDVTPKLNVSFVSPYTSAYLDARFGINVRNGEQAVWQNEYRNQIVQLTTLLGDTDVDGTVYPDTSKTYRTQWEITYGNVPPTDTAISDRSLISMYHEANGKTYFYFDDYGLPAYTYEFGESWVGFNITINGSTGKVTIAPIASSGWISFLINTPDASVPMDYTLRNRGDISGLIISVPGDMSGGEYVYNPVRFQVNYTKVFLNTYGVIKVDASLNILNYYPNNEKFMITMHDTAATGSAIFINGVPYTLGPSVIIDEEQVQLNKSEIYINDTIINVEDMEIKFYKQANETYDVSIYSPKNGQGTDLTGVTNVELGFAGAWYFESDYYVILLKDVKEYSWHPESLGYGYSGIILFMMIFLGVISVLWWKFRPEMLGFIDIAIIIGAEIILFIILV